MSTPTLDQALAAAPIDEALRQLQGGAAGWAATGLPERIALLERMMPRITRSAKGMVAAAAAAKGYDAAGQWATEDWAGGPWAVAQNVSSLLHTLRRMAAGHDPVPASAVRTQNGRTWVEVFPATGWDRLLLSGFNAQVRMLPGVTAQEARQEAAAAYRGRAAAPGVCAVLGAGNVAGITALDILDRLIAGNQVVAAKMNPVNAYVRPHFEDVFGEFVERGWLRFLDGGAAEGAYLAAHPSVDSVHVTGSARTHDAIVWGTDEQAAQRRRDDRPLNDKPLTSELGGVSPCLVVPGPWSEAELRFQAEHIVTSKMNNAGHNCIATQVLVLPAEWPGSDRLVQHVRDVLRALPARSDYYPGAAQRLDALRAAHPETESCGAGASGLLIDGLDPAANDSLLNDEVFASALAVVRLPGATPEQFLAAAVDFANDRLPGTLGATLLVHPRTERDHPAAVADAIDRLRYGTLGVNIWSAVGFLLGYTPWGAYPGHTRQDIGSGTGFVHNAFLLDRVEKTVLRAPFAPFPRGLFTGSPSLSPRPPYFVTNRTGPTTISRVTSFTAAPNPLRLPGIFASALRG